MPDAAKGGLYRAGATIDIGRDRENQEDYVDIMNLDADNLLCVMADGTGSVDPYPQPAVIIVNAISRFVEDVWTEQPDLFLSESEWFLKAAMRTANQVIGGLKTGNEERFAGYAASVTCCLLSENNGITVAHAGNTRLYILRNGHLQPLTRDDTKAAELLAEGKIDLDTYYVHPDRLTMTSGIGMYDRPKIQTMHGSIKDDDLVVMTTDGVHYAVRPEVMADIILSSNDCEDASANLVNAAKSTDYPDNMTAVVMRKARPEERK